MFSMHRQLTLDGGTTLTNGIKVVPKNDGEVYRLWAGVDRWDVENVIERTTGSRAEIFHFVCLVSGEIRSASFLFAVFKSLKLIGR